MIFNKTKGRYGYLIKWIIGLGDIICINFALFVLYKLGIFLNFQLTMDNRIGLLLFIVNFSYFICCCIIPSRLSFNIIFFDRIVQRSLTFISLYYLIFCTGLFLLDFRSGSAFVWGYFYVGLTFFFVSWHIIIRSLLKSYRRNGYNFRRIIILGEGQTATALFNELQSAVYGYKILGIFSNTPIALDSLNSRNIHRGRLSEMELFCEENRVDEIYCASDYNSESDIIQWVNFSERQGISFYLVPDFYGYIHRKLHLDFLQSIPVVAIQAEPLQITYNRLLKRTFDIVFSTFILVSIFPVAYVLLGIIIKLTSEGPVFFRQQRTGLQGQSFVCYKFRSMYINKDADVEIATRSDARVTPIGKFMRRTSLDELPQFFNVLIGNMSVVGPRPHMLKQTDLYKKLIDRFMIRHVIKPGISGWAQISGFRGETQTLAQMEGRFKKDMWYIENWSFLLDIKIIAVTVFQILKGDQKAY